MAKCQIASGSGFANGSTGQGFVGGGMLSLPFASCLLAFCLCLYSCSEAPPEAFPPISHKHGSPKERRRSQGCEAPAGLDLDQAAAFGNVLGRDGWEGQGSVQRELKYFIYCDKLTRSIADVANKKFMPPTPEELHSIMRVASPHIQRLVILGAQLGVRVGQCELLQLT